MGTRPATAAAVPLVRDGCLESLRTEWAAGWSCAPQARETAEGPAAISVAGSELPPQGLSERELLLVYDPPDQPAGVSDVRELFVRFGLAAQSPALLQVFEEARRVSQYDGLPVLILGETGTGKQRLAEAIHQLNPRRCEQRFITVNCAAIGETLAESTLFGHRRGAFTGAEYERLGAFRTADGGTLLLDEISDLDPLIQPKLLYAPADGCPGTHPDRNKSSARNCSIGTFVPMPRRAGAELAVCGPGWKW